MGIRSNDTASFSAVPPDGNTRDYGLGESLPSAPSGPDRIGRYVILDELGRGGMGVVWTAYDPKLDRKVAIKRLHGSAWMTVRQARFIREAQALARLNHANLVTVHDVDTHEGQLYMAMEYVDGQTLEDWLLAAPRRWSEIIEVFDQAGRGLAAAHAAGITHRDFKPSNMLITADGHVKVFDFGLAKYIDHGESVREDSDVRRLDADALTYEPDREDPELMEMIGTSSSLKLTKMGRFVGTPAYMAPEQYTLVDEHEIGAWTDQFSFGATLYEALYGRLPFAGNTLDEIYNNARSEMVREPRRDTIVPNWVHRVVLQAMRYEPDQRFASMNDLLVALRADPARRRRRILAYAGGAGLIGLAGFGVIQALVSDDGPAPCESSRERLAGVWDEEVREAVSDGLLATNLPFAPDAASRVVEGLDAYADAWTQQHTEICKATRVHGEQSESLLDVRMTCLDRRRGEMGALAKVLMTAEETTVTRAVSAVAELRPVDPCATAQPSVETIIPTDPAERESFLALQAQLDDANALLNAGRHTDARDLAVATGRNAGSRGFRRLLAEALVLEGRAHQELREPTTAQARLKEGIAIAAEIADARNEMQGWINLLFTTGVLLEQPNEARGFYFAAQSTLRRAGSPADLASSLAITNAAVATKNKNLEDANQAGEAALRIVLQSEGSNSHKYAQALTNLGVVAAKQQNWPLAERRLRESRQLTQQLLGQSHPMVSQISMNLANVLVQLAKSTTDEDAATRTYDEAEKLYERALAFRESTEGEQGENVARTLANLGLLQFGRGKRAEARRTLQRAAQLLRKQPGAEADLANILLNLGSNERREDNFGPAEAFYREALQLRQRVLGHEHTLVGRARLKLCRLHTESGEYSKAIKECERALEIFENSAAGRARLIETHALSAEIYEHMGQTTEANSHRDSAAELRGQSLLP